MYKISDIAPTSGTSFEMGERKFRTEAILHVTYLLLF